MLDAVKDALQIAASLFRMLEALRTYGASVTLQRLTQHPHFFPLQVAPSNTANQPGLNITKFTRSLSTKDELEKALSYLLWTCVVNIAPVQVFTIDTDPDNGKTLKLGSINQLLMSIHSDETSVWSYVNTSGWYVTFWGKVSTVISAGMWVRRYHRLSVSEWLTIE